MNIEIANRLVQMRKQKGFSQEALAEQLGISRQAVSKWERAESSPDTSNLITLAKLYGISLDELLDTDQEKFESSEFVPNETSVNDQKNFFDSNPVAKERIQDEVPISDYVNINWNGIHVKDGIDEIHVTWQGIQVIEDGKEVVRIGQRYRSALEGSSKDSVHIDNGGIWIDGEDYSDYNWKIDGIFTLIVLCIYLWIGFEHLLWHPGWIIFFMIPVASTFVQAIKRKNASLFAYPILIILGYLYFGFIQGVWHPTWFAFVTIPIYYAIVNRIKNRKKRDDY